MSNDELPAAAISGRAHMKAAEEVRGPLCCVKCYEAKHKPGTREYICRPMFLCPMCGNKRCPKATDHELACTDSNKPGQPGSIYE